MKKLVLIFGLLNLGICSNAQSVLPKNISDSLWSIWTNPSEADTIRLQALNRFIEEGYLRSQPDSAFYFAQLQHDFAEQKGLKKQMAEALYIKGTSLFEMGDFQNALIYLKQGLAINEEIRNKHGIGIILAKMGTVYWDLEDYSKSIECFTRCLIMFQETGDKRRVAVVLNNFGNVYLMQDDFVKALDYYLQSLKIKEQLNDRFGIANSLNNIGIIYWGQGDYVKALDYYLRGLKIREELGNKKAVAGSLVNIGVLYDDLGNLEKAMDCYNQSLKIFETLGDKSGVATALANIAGIYQKESDFVAAIDYYYQSLKIFEEIGSKKGILAGWGNVASIYGLQGNDRRSISCASKALYLAQEIGQVDDIKIASRTLLNAYLKTGQLDSASFYLHLLKRTIEQKISTNYFSMSENEKELYFATMESDFGRYYDFALFHHKSFPSLTDSAYNLALQNKGLTLKSSTAMRVAIINSGDSLLIADYEKWIQIKRQISDLYANGSDTKDLENEANFLEKQLVKKSNAFSDFNKIKNLNWRQVQSSLAQGECAIEFVNFSSRIDSAKPVIYAALLVKPKSIHPEIIRLCNESDLIEIMGAFQGNNFNYVNSIYGTKEEAHTALYQKIWQPLEPFLKEIKTVYFSPSGLLHKISFTSISKSQNVFLSDLYNFRQMSSTGKLVMQDDVAFGGLENFLLMGGVQYNSDTTEKKVWDYLPGSLSETDAINSYLQKKKFGVNYFKEDNASEKIFKEKITSSSIVHIATHGFFFPDPEQVREEMKANSESNQELIFRGTTNYANWSFVNNKNPLMRSGIVLAGANDVWERGALAEGEDGILTAQEVSNLDLRNTKLVVLSACETGLGDIKGSEGVFGLQRAFKMAGVKYLIMSLWQVPDKETSEFMILFYKNLIKEKDIPTTFQKTQKVMREKYDPYYWGAFVLIE